MGRTIAAAVFFGSVGHHCSVRGKWVGRILPSRCGGATALVEGTTKVRISTRIRRQQQ
jgi:hypothetical protein